MNNNGMVQVQSGTMILYGITQMVDDILTGGSWRVDSNSTLAMWVASNMSANITTNQGDVTLNGIGSIFTSIDALADNQGSFSVLNGRDFTTAGNLSNSGLLTIGTESDFLVSGNLTGTGNLTVDGTFTADSIVQNTLTVGAGAKVIIAARPGGPFGGLITPVPEPATWALFLMGGLVLMLRWRKR
jgi:hypothetical protein